MWKPGKLTSWLVVAGLAWTTGYVYNARYGGELSWLRMMYEQKMAIASQVNAPHRLLITGGSGAHYTIDAQLMQKELGIPVLNLGIDGPVGLDVVLPSVLDKIRPGDIVLLIPEYLLLADEDGFGDRSGQFGLAIGRPGLGGIPPKQLAQDLLMLGSPTLRAVVKSSLDVVEKGKLTGYYSDPVNANGDATVLKNRGSAPWWKLEIKNPISTHSQERITQFHQEVEQAGATLVLALPWVYASTDEKTIGNIQKTATELNKIAPLLYNKETLNVRKDTTLQGDTHYHLNPKGREIRSLELVEQLKPVLASQLTSAESTRQPSK